MKNFYLLRLMPLCPIALAISACMLEKEPEIPAGASNITIPDFDAAAVVSGVDNTFQLQARWSTRGTLNIMHHGWVWDESPEPTIEDDSIDLGELKVNFFATEIADLELGNLYYLRPYVTNGDSTFYGDEFCSFLGVNLSIDAGTKIIKGLGVQFNNTPLGSCTYLWDFGDGDTSTLAVPPPHTYDTIGNLTLRLTAVNGCGIVTRTIDLEIIDPFEDYWVPIPGGTFTMGCTWDQEPECSNDDGDEEPPHPVTISPFLMGRTEITQGQWKAVMGGNPSQFDACGLDCPVENVSWNDVKDFLDKLNATLPAGEQPFRLPTEAEWEYAARGGADASGMTKYAGSDNPDMVAWYGEETTDTVAQLLPNQFGLYDMSGNVWELVEDDYHKTYTGAPTNGSAWINNPPGDTCANRGGSWQNTTQSSCRVANRGYSIKSVPQATRGFCLARSY